MARQTGILIFTGSMGAHVYYKMRGNYYVRRKPQIDRAYMERKGYRHTLENSTEFGACARAGKLLRHSLGEALRDTADHEITQRMNGLMSRIKNLDQLAPHGKRTVANGIRNPAAIKELSAFQFNRHAALSQVLARPAEWDAATGTIRLKNLVASGHLPAGGWLYALIQAYRLRIDFTSGESELAVTQQQVRADSCGEIELTQPPVKMKGGTDLYLLKVSFFQAKNQPEVPEYHTVNAMQVVGLCISETVSPGTTSLSKPGSHEKIAGRMKTCDWVLRRVCVNVTMPDAKQSRQNWFAIDGCENMADILNQLVDTS
jgi:hypothetical protein